MKIIYHGDDDGISSAVSVKRYEIKRGTKKEDIKYFKRKSYYEEFPLDEINKGEKVYIVDYSIPPETMLKLLDITKDVIWIDHHKSAIDKYKDFPIDIKGIRFSGVAACLLTEVYMKYDMEQNIDSRSNIWFKEGNKVYRTIPNQDTENLYPTISQYIKYIADWDIFQFDFKDSTTLFHIGFGTLEHEVDNDIWDDLYYNSDTLNIIIEDGKIAKKFRDNWASEYIKNYGFEVKIKGYKQFKAIALNIHMINSEYFDSIKSEYDIFIWFSFNGKYTNFTVCGEKINILPIVESYKGGGHKHIGGFKLNGNKFPFKIVKKKKSLLSIIKNIFK